MSGNLVASDSFELIESYHPTLLKGYKVTQFAMTIPIPSYLIAIVAGDIAQKSVGTKTFVITEPGNLDSYA
jgi:leukotriene-A4 hydrolase